jgi:hypothetical protein
LSVIAARYLGAHACAAVADLDPGLDLVPDTLHNAKDLVFSDTEGGHVRTADALLGDRDSHFVLLLHIEGVLDHAEVGSHLRV